ncbi:NAD(P)H-dependent oxidoreductase [Rhodoferax sp. BAB1]|uniref:NAD(P)H-dependent oxidoreductase n=1 Tax=Rhodoferax sp. BAB1 TaxID=2741720 RepID=UPI001575B465|nr:NAD(P)H-dependent oxidoreductase [Rhodoferax sp. BAB1]QKO22438.1 NAD(P)H-dependent oxidoreductase [Rhodoferax sp. BAB1]
MDRRRILILQGHPDASAPHLCHTLAAAYAEGARQAGHEVHIVEIARLDFPLLRSQQEWEHAALPAGLQAAQDEIAWAQHLLIVFPLWLGDMPALLKGFLEQVARPGFAFKGDAAERASNPFIFKGLKGRSARIVVTMGMPALIYRWVFRARGVGLLKRNILGFVGISPVRDTLIGMVDRLGEAGVRKWQDRLRTLGARAV